MPVSCRAFDSLVEFSLPEVHRIPLDSVVLEILTLRGGVVGFADPLNFPWIEPPPLAHLHAAVSRLEQLAAVAVNPSGLCKV